MAPDIQEIIELLGTPPTGAIGLWEEVEFG